ncbi:MAG: DUF2179 domain-containing protein [Planctomycetes bacterium]|nr:DUF2179 domain-containing protein [Planctomycetota bacterium]
MTGNIVLDCLLIVLARVGDQTLGTVRTVAIINGRRALAFGLGFFEVLLWIVVVSSVMKQIEADRVYAIFYAVGFALGNYVGITIERWVGFGDQVLRVFTRGGDAMAALLRDQGFRVTCFNGSGRDGPVQLLFLETPRRRAALAARMARQIDPGCFYLLDDIRTVSTAAPDSVPLPAPAAVAAASHRK